MAKRMHVLKFKFLSMALIPFMFSLLPLDVEAASRQALYNQHQLQAQKDVPAFDSQRIQQVEHCYDVNDTKAGSVQQSGERLNENVTYKLTVAPSLPRRSILGDTPVDKQPDAPNNRKVVDNTPPQ